METVAENKQKYARARFTMFLQSELKKDSAHLQIELESLSRDIKKLFPLSIEDSRKDDFYELKLEICIEKRTSNFSNEIEINFSREETVKEHFDLMDNNLRRLIWDFLVNQKIISESAPKSIYFTFGPKINHFSEFNLLKTKEVANVS